MMRINRVGSGVSRFGAEDVYDGLNLAESRRTNVFDIGLDFQVVVSAASRAVQLAIDVPERAIAGSQRAVSIKPVDLVEPVHGIAVVADHPRFSVGGFHVKDDGVVIGVSEGRRDEDSLWIDRLDRERALHERNQVGSDLGCVGVSRWHGCPGAVRGLVSADP